MLECEANFMDIEMCFIKLVLIHGLKFWIGNKEKFVSRSSLTINYLFLSEQDNT